MIEIVNDAYDLAGKTEVTDAERARLSITWAKQLNGYIPGDRLEEVFNYVFDQKANNYLILPVDLKLGYGEILDAEKSDLEQREKEAEDNRRAENPTAFCRNGHNHLTTQGTDVLVELSFNGVDFFASPCPDCRPKAHAQWTSDRAAKMKENAPKALQFMLAGSVGQIAKNDALKYAVRKYPNPHYEQMIFVGVSCSGCHEEIKGKYIRLSPDFMLCKKCDEAARSVDRAAIDQQLRGAA